MKIPKLPPPSPAYRVFRDKGGWSLTADDKTIHTVDTLAIILEKLENHILKHHEIIGKGHG